MDRIHVSRKPVMAIEIVVRADGRIGQEVPVTPGPFTGGVVRSVDGALVPTYQK